jgi:CelD/BcsL family acetyltransferase involved in cellulose biosynthesis
MRARILPWPEARAYWDMAESRGHLTPYQTWGWVDAWIAAVAEPRGEQGIALLVEDEESGRGLALPLASRRVGPSRVAAVVGDDHANFKFPVMLGADAPWDTSELVSAIKAAMRVGKIDMLTLDNMPLQWEGVPNPLGPMLTQAAPNMGYKTALPSDVEDYLAAHMGAQQRKKLRQKERGLERLAPLRFVRAATPEEARVILDAFFTLKHKRFAELDVPDVFQERGIEAFMRRAAVEGLAEGKPALILFALFSGDQVVAVYGGSQHGGRFAASINAMALDAVRRHSPGDLLLIRVIGECCKAGIRTFDLGLGGLAYKQTYCPDVEEVFDGVITARGLSAGIGWLWLGQRRLKARLKDHPAVIGSVQRLRRLLARSGAG